MSEARRLLDRLDADMARAAANGGFLPNLRRDADLVLIMSRSSAGQPSPELSALARARCARRLRELTDEDLAALREATR